MLTTAPPGDRTIDATATGEVEHGEIIVAARSSVDTSAEDDCYGRCIFGATIGAKEGALQRSSQRVGSQGRHRTE
ncbi:hypothetical protein GCM10027430_25930 [Lysobacter tyrosinilyticus]